MKIAEEKITIHIGGQIYTFFIYIVRECELNLKIELIWKLLPNCTP